MCSCRERPEAAARDASSAHDTSAGWWRSDSCRAKARMRSHYPPRTPAAPVVGVHETGKEGDSPKAPSGRAIPETAGLCGSSDRLPEIDDVETKPSTPCRGQ